MCDGVSFSHEMKEILLFVMCLNLGDFVLSELSQTRKDNGCIVDLTYAEPKKAELPEPESWWAVAGGRGRGGCRSKGPNSQLEDE